MNDLIKLESDKLRYMGLSVDNPCHVTVKSGVTAVIGANGSGKSTLGRILEKGWNIATNIVRPCRPDLKVKFIEFGDIHSLSGFHVEYYQQRHEATMNDEVPTVRELMGQRIDMPQWDVYCRRMRLEGIEDKKVNFLSSGELRKLLVVNVLLESPDLLIMDNPYIGLDAASRDLLDEAIADMSSRGISVMLLLCNPGEIPTVVDTVIPMIDMRIGEPITREGDVQLVRNRVMSLMDYAVDLERIPKSTRVTKPYEVALELRGCNVKYGRRMILENVSWTVRRGECWVLAGPNGAGKSVLLSLVYADNPQAYSNDITIFDRKRGSGESIWDIKSRIGYVSPEMHLYFRHHGTVADVVAQGLGNTLGSFGRTNASNYEAAMRWLELFHLESFADRRYSTLSTGEQRMVLIARTLIKHPDLLILDEPLHGLDAARKRSVRAVVNALVHRDSPTLIYVTHFLPEVPECVSFTKTLERLKNV